MLYIYIYYIPGACVSQFGAASPSQAAYLLDRLYIHYMQIHSRYLPYDYTNICYIYIYYIPGACVSQFGAASPSDASRSQHRHSHNRVGCTHDKKHTTNTRNDLRCKKVVRRRTELSQEGCEKVHQEIHDKKVRRHTRYVKMSQKIHAMF
jgi:hypothetical protein